MKLRLSLFSTLLLLPFALLLAQQEKGRGIEQTLTCTQPYEVEQLPKLAVDGHPKNIVLMIGDGMSLSHIATLKSLNHGNIYLQNAQVIGLMETCTADTLITDSAASGTAMATGVKTNYHHLGVDPEGKELYNMTDFTREHGLSSGVVSVCRLWDATPAAFCCHNIDRDNSEEIIAGYASSNVDLVIGAGTELMTQRSDGRDLFVELQSAGFQTPLTMAELKSISEGKVFAALAPKDHPEPKLRGDYLTEASLYALEHLAQNDQGFFLMIEGSQLDDYGHFNDLDLLMQETADFDRTAGAVMKWASQNGETLVIITADHETGGLTLVGGDLNGTVVGKFSTGSHSGVLVPVYSYGPGAKHFTGIFTNADIFHKITRLFNKQLN